VQAVAWQAPHVHECRSGMSHLDSTHICLSVVRCELELELGGCWGRKYLLGSNQC